MVVSDWLRRSDGLTQMYGPSLTNKTHAFRKRGWHDNIYHHSIKVVILAVSQLPLCHMTSVCSDLDHGPLQSPALLQHSTAAHSDASPDTDCDVCAGWWMRLDGREPALLTRHFLTQPQAVPDFGSEKLWDSNQHIQQSLWSDLAGIC